jgi:hypothetical protein
MPAINPVVIDFETYYDKEYSLKELPTWQYVHDPKFDAYLVSVYGEDIQFIGDPRKFDWTQITGRTLIMHNASFDLQVLLRLQELGIVKGIPDALEFDTFDTADMVAYFKLPRNLKSAAKFLLGIEADKTMRDVMQGKTLAEAEALGLKGKLDIYGAQDGILPYELWKRYHDKWPEAEQELSHLNLIACIKGIPVNPKKIEDSVNRLERNVFNALNELPWYPDAKPLSPKAIREQGRLSGIPVPASLAQDDEDCMEWEDTYAEKFPWVRAIRTYRRQNMLLQKLKVMQANVDKNNRYVYSTMYFGGHTGRFSGRGAKFNPQNLPRKEMFCERGPDGADIPGSGVDVRKLLEAPPGHVFLIGDFAQVEARFLLWRAGDQETLDRIIKEKYNIYEAMALKILGADRDVRNFKKRFPAEYQMVKGATLGCGYQMGGERFEKQAPLLTGGQFCPSREEADAVVARYRAANPKVVAHWDWHRRILAYSAAHKDPTHEVELASGRVLVYYNPVCVEGPAEAPWKKEYHAKYMPLDVAPRKLFPGLLTENEIQATARDLLRDTWIRCARENQTPLLSVHDELVFLSPEDRADENAKQIMELMTTLPAWAKGCPIDVDEIVVTKVYTK